MHKHMVRRIRALGPTLAASMALFVPGCVEDPLGDEAAGFEGASEEGGFDDDAGLDDKATSSPSKIRNEGTGTCLRRSTSQKVGNGYAVYQTSCSDTAAEALWRAECTSGICRYITGGSTTYCLKASNTVKASGGSFSVYAATCSSDSDQKWSVRDLGGGKMQLKSVETGRCAQVQSHTGDALAPEGPTRIRAAVKTRSCPAVVVSRPRRRASRRVPGRDRPRRGARRSRSKHRRGRTP